MSENLERVQELHELKKDFHVANQELIIKEKNYWNKLLLGSNNKTLNESQKSWLEKYSNRAVNNTQR